MDKLSNDILTDKKFVEKLMTKKENNGISNNITQRKKEFLEMNNISYENTDVKEIEDNNEIKISNPPPKKSASRNIDGNLIQKSENIKIAKNTVESTESDELSKNY